MRPVLLLGTIAPASSALAGAPVLRDGGYAPKETWVEHHTKHFKLVFDPDA